MIVDGKVKEKFLFLHATDIGNYYLVTGRQRRRLEIISSSVEILKIRDKELWKDIGEILKDENVDILLPKDILSTKLTKYDIIVKERIKDIEKASGMLEVFRWKLLYNTKLPSIFDFYRFSELYNILVGKGIYIHYDNLIGQTGEHIDEYVEYVEKFRPLYEKYLKFKPTLLAIEDSTSIEEIESIKDEYEADM